MKTLTLILREEVDGKVFQVTEKLPMPQQFLYIAVIIRDMEKELHETISSGKPLDDTENKKQTKTKQ